MKQKEVFKKIGGIIQELNDQYEYLKTVPDDLNDLELELFVSNAHFLTDHIEILSKLNLQNVKTKKPPVEKTETSREQKYFEPVVQQMKHAGATDEKPSKSSDKPVEITFTPEENTDVLPVSYLNPEPGTQLEPYAQIHEEPETIRHELILDDSQNWDEDEMPDEDVRYDNEELKETRKRKPIIPADVVDDVAEINEVKAADKKQETKTEEQEVLTINQKISSQLGDKALGMTEQLSAKPISDIKLAITLNDKLLYVKDLFNGYNLAYSEAIEILNRFNTLEEAMRFLKTNYVTKNNWDGKPETTGKFYALLKRRYT